MSPTVLVSALLIFPQGRSSPASKLIWVSVTVSSSAAWIFFHSHSAQLPALLVTLHCRGHQTTSLHPMSSLNGSVCLPGQSEQAPWGTGHVVPPRILFPGALGMSCAPRPALVSTSLAWPVQWVCSRGLTPAPEQGWFTNLSFGFDTPYLAFGPQQDEWIPSLLSSFVSQPSPDLSFLHKEWVHFLLLNMCYLTSGSRLHIVRFCLQQTCKLRNSQNTSDLKSFSISCLEFN